METQAFARIYDAHYPRVFRYLVGRIRKPQDAEELAAEVFTTALESLERGAEPQQVGSWLVGIADHLASRFWRIQVSEPRVYEMDTRAGADPEELAIDRLQGRALRRCLDSLSPDHRRTLLLRIVAGLSAREVAEIMGKTEEAVRGLQYRALNALRKHWTEAERRNGLLHTPCP